jgi:sec-independent protein translocase protein TatA
MPTPGPLELVIILVIALLILGPGKLPDVGAALGKSIREFRKASSDVQDAVKVNVDTTPLPNTLSSQAVPNETPAPPSTTPVNVNTPAEPAARRPAEPNEAEPAEPVASGSSSDSKPGTK